MAKITDFGGLPSATFTKMVATFSTSAAIGAPDKIKLLTMVANEEHAAANSLDFNIIDVVTLSIQIEQLHESAFKGVATVAATAITEMVDLLDNLRKAWKP